MFLAIVSPRIPQVVAICSLVTSTFPDGEWHGFPSGMVQSKPPPFVWRIVVSYLAIVSPSDTNRLHHLQQIRHALFDLRISTNYSRSQYSNYKWKKKSQTSLQCCFTLSNIRIVATNQVNLFFTIAIAIYSITPWNQSKLLHCSVTQISLYHANIVLFRSIIRTFTSFFLRGTFTSLKLECIYDCNFAFRYCQERVQHSSPESKLWGSGA
jgi:hypothetical protein